MKPNDQPTLNICFKDPENTDHYTIIALLNAVAAHANIIYQRTALIDENSESIPLYAEIDDSFDFGSDECESHQLLFYFFTTLNWNLVDEHAKKNLSNQFNKDLTTLRKHCHINSIDIISHDGRILKTQEVRPKNMDVDTSNHQTTKITGIPVSINLKEGIITLIRTGNWPPPLHNKKTLHINLQDEIRDIIDYIISNPIAMTVTESHKEIKNDKENYLYKLKENPIKTLLSKVISKLIKIYPNQNS